jgi:hypothetical protein
MADLYARLRADLDAIPQLNPEAGPEAKVQHAIRCEGRDKGVLLMRNNVGVLEDRTGRPVRFGLANDSKTVNTHTKSGDLIGIRPVLIGPEHLGMRIGQFVSRECKAPGWRHNPNDARENAQLNFATLILSLGGDACITDRVGTL